MQQRAVLVFQRLRWGVGLAWVHDSATGVGVPTAVARSSPVWALKSATRRRASSLRLRLGESSKRWVRQPAWTSRTWLWSRACSQKHSMQ